jgi:exopolysaccharide biosynthesis polyprenyl glycosylphosphotransferase
MSTSDTLIQLQAARANQASPSRAGATQGVDRFSMLLDFLSVFGSGVFACAFILHRTGAGLLRTIALYPHWLWIPVVLIFGYSLLIVFNCQRLDLYTPERQTSILHEQRKTLEACLTAGLLLAGTLYLLHPKDPRTGIVITTVAVTALLLNSRRLISRMVLYRSFKQGAGARNVLIVGTGPTAHALRQHLQNVRHLGYAFKGFIEVPSSTSAEGSRSPHVVGRLESVFEHVRRHFVDEIFFATPCERSEVQQVLEESRYHDVNIRLVPDLYDAAILNPTVEYLGEFPTIPLCRRRMPETRLFLKRALDLMISATALAALSPLLLIIAFVIKHDSLGPVFYVSERLGKKGRVFRCLKFRPMVKEAEGLLSALRSKNQRDGILFKLEDDPRITRVGRFLRKYSLDELPQFINVLRGEMSVVGPRPL